MTKKQISLMEKRPVNQIEKGTIVKKSGDMFIVAKISEAQFSSAVDEALFHSSYPSSRPQASSRYHVAERGAVRNPAEPKYVLVSLSNGSKYYTEFLSLPNLLMRMTKDGFEVVQSLEIKEVPATF